MPAGGRRQRRASHDWGVFSGPFAGVDQGTDWSGAGPIPALGAGKVTYIGESSIIEGGTFPVVVYELADAPALAPSKYVYIAENFRPTVRQGKRLKEGTIVGEAVGKYPYIEVGFNATPTGWNPVAPLNPDPHGPKAAGYAMQQLITERVTGAPIVLSGSRTPSPMQPGTRTRPGAAGGSGGGDGGILGFFDAAGNDIGSAAGWVGSGFVGAGETVWNDTVGAVGGVVDFLRAMLWLVNPLNWLRAFEALVGVALIGAAIAIAVGAEKVLGGGAAGAISSAAAE